MASPRALRVGVLLRDNLVEEHLFLDNAPITAGQSLRCRLSIPADGWPAEHALLVRDQGRWLLRPLPQMIGRIAPGEGDEIELSATATGAVPPTISIGPGARAKLRLGDATLLLQEVAAPPVLPRPRLPASVRSSLADRIDARLAAIIALSLCAHLAIATWAWLDDVETGSMFSPRITAERHRPDVITITVPDDLVPAPAPPDGPPGPAPGAAAPASPRQTPRPIVPRSVNPAEPSLSAAEAMRYAQVLTGDDETSGATAGDLRARQPQGDLKQQIDDVRARSGDVAVGRDPRARDTDSRLGTVPTGPRIDAPDQIVRRADDREPRQPRIEIIPPRRPPGRPDHDLTVEAVLAKIRTAYMPALQRCYRLGLTHDGALKGKIQLAFTVDAQGRTTEPEASGLTPEVDACVLGLMPAWRFGIPRDKDRQPTEASFQLGLVLAAGD